MGFYAKDEPACPVAERPVTVTLSRARKSRPRNAWPPILTVGIGHRFYSPELGRWVSRDPMGDVHCSLYAFLENESIAHVDVTGLWGWPRLPLPVRVILNLVRPLPWEVIGNENQWVITCGSIGYEWVMEGYLPVWFYKCDYKCSGRMVGVAGFTFELTYKTSGMWTIPDDVPACKTPKCPVAIDETFGTWGPSLPVGTVRPKIQ